MTKISSTSYENEIHGAGSPFNEDSKNVILLAKEALISRERGPENLGKMVKHRKTSILIGNTGLYSLASKSLHYFGFPAC